MKELKPCPFCGNERVELIYNPLVNKFCICCPNCYASGPLLETEHLATESWNRTGYFSKP